MTDELDTTIRALEAERIRWTPPPACRDVTVDDLLWRTIDTLARALDEDDHARRDAA